LLLTRQARLSIHSFPHEPIPEPTINVAALFEEKDKRLKYHQVVLPNTIDPSRVVPFAIEATDRLDPSALAFLHKVCGPNSYHRSQFLNSVSNTCACFSAKCLSASREHFYAPPNVVISILFVLVLMYVRKYDDQVR
jgi:hypothetical protein